jgi:hypothetical protein
MAIGLVGLVATLGILIYELRNSQTYVESMQRARMLEQRLELGSGGLLSEPRGPAPGSSSASCRSDASSDWLWSTAPGSRAGRTSSPGADWKRSMPQALAG